MTSTRIEESIQARQADFRTPIRCDAGHVQSIDEQIENFCVRRARAKAESTNENSEGMQ